MRNKLAALAATTVFVAGGTLATATSAFASVDPPGGSWDHTWTTSDAKQGGTVYVEENGDVVSLCDTASDGYAPRAKVYVEELTVPNAWDYKYSLTASGGLGSCDTSRASDGGVHDLPEHTRILIDIWLGTNNGYLTTHIYLNDH